MVIKSTLGYVFLGLGVIGTAAWAIPNFRSAIPQADAINDMVLISVSIFLALIGIFFAMGKGRFGGRQSREVPIYHGKNIVGYRRS